jgi:transcriptional regulator with XRE-family HTH domain
MRTNGDGKEPREAGAGAAVDGLGEKLRQLRLERGHSLTRVADATGISSSFLSLVETGRSDLTVARLVRLAAYYGVPVTDLLPEDEDDRPEIVRRKNQRRIPLSSDHMDIWVLVHEGDRAMMPVIGAYEVGGGMREFVSYDSDQFDHVLEGSIRVIFEGEDEIVLCEGDSAYYSAKRPHRYENAGDTPARVFHVRSPAHDA